MGGHRRVDAGPLVPWQPRKLAVLVSLRDDSHPLDVSPAHRQRSGKNNHQRDIPFHRLSCYQCNGHVAIPLDRPNPALATFAVCRKFHERSHIAARPEIQNAKFCVANIFAAVCFRSAVKKSFWTCLTEEIARLGFAPVSSAELERIWVCSL